MTSEERVKQTGKIEQAVVSHSLRFGGKVVFNPFVKSLKSILGILGRTKQKSAVPGYAKNTAAAVFSLNSFVK